MFTMIIHLYITLYFFMLFTENLHNNYFQIQKQKFELKTQELDHQRLKELQEEILERRKIEIRKETGNPGIHTFLETIKRNGNQL